MSAMLAFVRHRVQKAVERDRRAEKRIESISWTLWRWREWKLAALAICLSLLDFTSTIIGLELSGNPDIYEGGMLAGWALRVGGLGWLFLVDLGAVIALVLAAIAIRAIFRRFGFGGLARAAFLAMLMPYAMVAAAAVINNLIVTFA